MSLAGLSLRDLEYVVAVAELSHFGRAAERCGVSQPSLSGQIRRLEALLGLTIFERSPRNVRLTAKGRVVVTQARAVLEQAHRLLELAREHGETLAGPFHLGIIPTIGPYLLPYLLPALKPRYPQIELVLTEALTADLVRQLRSGDLDAVILSPPIADHGLTLFELYFEPFVLMHPPGHAVAEQVPLVIENLNRPGLLLLEEGHCLRDQALSLCAKGADHSRRHATGLEMLKHMVAAGEGFSIVPALAATAPPGMAGLVAFAGLADAAAGRRVALACRPSDPRAGHLAHLANVIAGAIPHEQPASSHAPLPRLSGTGSSLETGDQREGSRRKALTHPGI